MPKKSLKNYYLWKVKKFHGDSAKNGSARAKKLEGAPNAPPPLSLYRVKNAIFETKMQITESTRIINFCKCIQYSGQYISDIRICIQISEFIIECSEFGISWTLMIRQKCEFLNMCLIMLFNYFQIPGRYQRRTQGTGILQLLASRPNSLVVCYLIILSRQ